MVMSSLCGGLMASRKRLTLCQTRGSQSTTRPSSDADTTTAAAAAAAGTGGTGGTGGPAHPGAAVTPRPPSATL